MSNVVDEIVIVPFGKGGAELGMTRAEMLEQINYLDGSITTTLEFQTQIIFGWLVAMFFVAHRLSRSQLLTACVFFVAISMLNLGVLAAAVSKAEQWYSFLYPTLESNDPLDALGMLLSIVGNGWAQVTVILSVYVACIWWAASCRRNQPKDIGSPL